MLSATATRQAPSGSMPGTRGGAPKAFCSSSPTASDDHPTKRSSLFMKRALVLALVSFLVAVVASPEEPSHETQAAALAKLDALLATAVVMQTTPPILSDDEAVNSPSGDISLTGTISRAGVPFDLRRFGAQYRGFKGRTAI